MVGDVKRKDEGGEKEKKTEASTSQRRIGCWQTNTDIMIAVQSLPTSGSLESISPSCSIASALD